MLAALNLLQVHEAQKQAAFEELNVKREKL
jgi:hypothetical protein